MMNASEILELVRAGYTRAEIDAMGAGDDPQPHDDPQPEQPHDDQQPEQSHDDPQPVPAWAQTLNNTLDELRKTIQASNIARDDMGDPETEYDAAEAAAARYLTGKDIDKSNKGGNKKK